MTLVQWEENSSKQLPKYTLYYQKQESFELKDDSRPEKCVSADGSLSSPISIRHCGVAYV